MTLDEIMAIEGVKKVRVDRPSHSIAVYIYPWSAAQRLYVEDVLLVHLPAFVMYKLKPTWRCM